MKKKHKSFLKIPINEALTDSNTKEDDVAAFVDLVVRSIEARKKFIKSSSFSTKKG